MLKLKQKGKNTDYPREGILWILKDPELPDWIVNNFKVVIGDSGISELFFRETSLGYEILLSGSSSGVKIDKEKSGGIVKSKTHPLLYLTEKQINLLYDKKELQPL